MRCGHVYVIKSPAKKSFFFKFFVHLTYFQAERFFCVSPNLDSHDCFPNGVLLFCELARLFVLVFDVRMLYIYIFRLDNDKTQIFVFQMTSHIFWPIALNL